MNSYFESLLPWTAVLLLMSACNNNRGSHEERMTAPLCRGQFDPNDTLCADAAKEEDCRQCQLDAAEAAANVSMEGDHSGMLEEASSDLTATDDGICTGRRDCISTTKEVCTKKGGCYWYQYGYGNGQCVNNPYVCDNGPCPCINYESADNCDSQYGCSWIDDSSQPNKCNDEDNRCIGRTTLHYCSSNGKMVDKNCASNEACEGSGASAKCVSIPQSPQNDLVPTVWSYGRNGAVLVTKLSSIPRGIRGDFDGDGRVEFLNGLSGYGIELNRLTASGVQETIAETRWTNQSDALVRRYWNATRVGDFDGDGRHDAIVFSSSDVRGAEEAVVISYKPNSGIVAITEKVVNGWIGGWHVENTYYGDPTDGAGDFDGDGRDEILVHSSWGWGLWELRPGQTALTSLALSPHDTMLCGWRQRKEDDIWGVGDFDADGRAEIIVRNPGAKNSTTWLGMIGLDSSGRFCSESVHRGGSWFGAWKFSYKDEIKAIGDFNGDRRDDIIIWSPWGWGEIYFDNTLNPASTWVHSHGTHLASWELSSTLLVVERGADLDGDGYDDLIMASSDNSKIAVVRGTSSLGAHEFLRVDDHPGEADRILPWAGDLMPTTGDELLFVR